MALSFCHNAFLQDATAADVFIWEKFVEFLQSRRGILDGVVFSGGEPLMQNSLADAMAEVKALGYQIGLHTGGYRPRHLERILPLTDWVGFDITGTAGGRKVSNCRRRQQSSAGGRRKPVAAAAKRCRLRMPDHLRSAHFADCRHLCDCRSVGCPRRHQIFLQKYRPVESDKTTADADCEQFFLDSDLLNSLRSKFAVFDIRK